MKGKQPMENNRWVASRRFKLYTARTQKEKAITQPRTLSPGNSKLDFMVSQHPKLKSGRFVKDVLAKVG